MSPKLGLQYHSTLNSQVWQADNQLKPVIKNQLLKIANYWASFAHIPEDAVEDVVFTGSLANYNYTPFSDFDLHLVVDMEKLTIKDPELRNKNIFHMKALWAKTHPGIKIYGYPVELFAEDKNTRHPLTQGIYSLKHDAWLHMPTHEDINYENDANLKSKVTHFARVIDDLIDNNRDLTTIKAFKEKLRLMRGDSIQKHGELRGVNNLVFKELRNLGYLDKLSQHETNKFDTEMSLNEQAFTRTVRPMLHVEEETPHPEGLLNLHLASIDDGGSTPDTPMKHGTVFLHNIPEHRSVFYTDHHDYHTLPRRVMNGVLGKIKNGYQIQKMVHVYTPYGATTYAHMSRSTTSDNRLFRFEHYDQF